MDPVYLLCCNPMTTDNGFDTMVVNKNKNSANNNASH